MPPIGIPPPPPGAPPAAASLCGLRMVSSVDKIRQHASVAAAIAFSFTRAGSHTKLSHVLQTSPESMSTPIQRPDSSSTACFARSLFRTLVLSKPALSHRQRGMISRLFANAAIASWCLPCTFRASSRRYLDSSISIAPPPATAVGYLIARRAIMMLSCKLRSVSSMNCSEPPRTIMVAVFALGQPVNKLNLSFPNERSSNSAHDPSTVSGTLFTDV
mmetsp:Transcript_12085/g.21865  ORF Transcript_12085/g.21865 Transcript_12085/m.21865 type:complete len:217 (-) Transcript_12085:1080-1730(-)